MSEQQHQGVKPWLFLLPLAFFILLLVFLLKGLFSDPTVRESSVLQRPFPVFALADLMDEQKVWRQSDLQGEVSLVNVWGTWCITCDQELPYLTQLRQQGVKIVGLYYDQQIDPDFDQPRDMNQLRQQVRDKLQRLGNPYSYNIFDHNRELLLDLGVTGAPETFLLDSRGVIRVHHLGDINPRVWQAKFADVYQQLQREITQS